MATSELNLIISAEDKASKTLGAVGSSISKIAKVSAVAFSAAAGAFAVYAKKSIDAYNEEIAVATKLQTIVLNQKKNTMANVEALKAQASAMQKVGVFGDEVVMAAQAQLATFDLQGKSIEKVIPGLLDMLAAERGLTAGMEDAKQVAQGLGKAFNGQFDVLKKQGFVITDAQKRMIEFGNEEQKTKAITEILGTTYKGMNEALRQTFQGQMIAAKNTLGDFMELSGKYFVEILTPTVAKFNEWTASIGGAQGMLDLFTSSLSIAREKTMEWWDSFMQATEWSRNFIVEMMTPAIILLRDTFIGSWIQIREAIEPVRPQLEQLGKILGGVLTVALVAVGYAITAVVVAITTFVTYVTKAVFGAIELLTLKFEAMFRKIEEVKQAWASLRESMSKGIDTVINIFKKEKKEDNGGKALGGAVTRGRATLVGENRPEVFVPSQNGNIRQLDQVGGMKSVTVNFNNVSVRGDSDLEYIVEAVKKTLGRENELTRMGAI